MAKRNSNPLMSSELPSLKWLDRLEELATVLQKSDADSFAVFEPARKTFSEKIFYLDHVGLINVLHQSAAEVLRIASAEIPNSHSQWALAAAEVWRRAPEEVSRIVERRKRTAPH